MFSSIGGEYYQEPEVFRYMRDFMEFARKVIIPVQPERVARYVKIVLYFDARWILISEVKFESGDCQTLSCLI